MFVLLRYVTRSFVVGVAVGMLFAPRPGVETRKMLSARIAAFTDQLSEVAALPPIEPEKLRTNGHPERPATKRPRSGADARTS